jgi:hypothetical protein
MLYSKPVNQNDASNSSSNPSCQGGIRSHAHWLPLIASFIAAWLTGCSPSNKPIIPQKQNAQQSRVVDAQPSVQVPHPEYVNWSRFDVGASVTRFRVVSNANGKVEVTTKFTLTEKSDSHILVTMQVNVQRPNEALEKNPEEHTRFPSDFTLPDGMTAEFFQLPSQKAKRVGEEELEIAGRKIQTEVFEWTESNETGPMQVKLWRSNDIPGRIARQEMLIEASQTKTIEEIREVAWQ